jgi:hypothetical protein
MASRVLNDTFFAESTNATFASDVLALSSLNAYSEGYAFINVSDATREIFYITGYGDMVMNYGGLYVHGEGGSGGQTIANGGLRLTGGMSVLSKGFAITGGLTTNADCKPGLQAPDGLQVTGGTTFFSNQLFVTGGVTVEGNGLRVTDGLTVFAGGATVRVNGHGMIH